MLYSKKHTHTHTRTHEKTRYFLTKYAICKETNSANRVTERGHELAKERERERERKEINVDQKYQKAKCFFFYCCMKQSCAKTMASYQTTNLKGQECYRISLLKLAVKRGVVWRYLQGHG